MTANRQPSVYIETHGCKLNQADSQELARQFTEAGYRLAGGTGKVDVYVVNTCTVTHVADGKARHALRKARRQYPGALVVATGCYAQRAPQQVVQVADVDLVLGNTSKGLLVQRVEDAFGFPQTACSTADAGLMNPTAQQSVLELSAPVKVKTPHITPQLFAPSAHLSHISDQEREKKPFLETSRAPTRNPSFLHPVSKSALLSPLRIRAMVKIQEGCDQVCAYCIVPKVRGRERSIPPNVLLKQVQRLVAQGHQEVVLTGTQLGTYGFDIPGTSLAYLLERLLRETTVPRLRVSSLQPQELTDELLRLWRNPRLCPHFHIPLQSGSKAILGRMRRRYLPGQYAKAVESIRKRMPDAAITADVIVGFPGETEAMFQETHSFCSRIEYAGLHVFPYSPRPGTSAAHFQHLVDDQVKRERTGQLLALAREQAHRYRQGLLGSTRPVLWERSQKILNATIWSGLTDNYVRVVMASPQALENRVTSVLLEHQAGDALWGREAST